MLSGPSARRALTVLFAINAVGAGAAAVVLALSSGAIPSIAGIAIDPSQNLLPYLLAAVTQGAGVVVALNVGVRVVMIAALAVCAPGRAVTPTR